MSWAEERLEELEAKGKENWDASDWEAYYYIKNVCAESDYYDCYDD